MSAPTHTASLFGGAIGVLQQLANELMSRVTVQVGPLPDVPIGDVIDTRRGAARDAADAVEVLLDALRGRHDVDPQRARATRPLLLDTTVQGSSSGTSTRLVVDADAPDAGWGTAGRESAMVAVYVDGVYHSTIVVLHERSEPYEVNLGELPAGGHRVELRAATDVAPTMPVVRSASARVTSGDEALVDRYAPVFVMRDCDTGERNSSSRSDAPLLMTPAITHHPDGSRTIEYRVVLSNEDGGTAPPDLLAKFGRTIDAEPLYRVTIDADGRVTDEQYQSPVHRWLAFDGEHHGARPILRVSTANNLVSARPGLRGAERWSDAAIDIIAPETSDHEVMRAHPWTWRVMALELLREGRTAAADAVRGARQIGDPRRYVFLGPLDDAARAAIAAAGGLVLVLADGSRVLAKIAKGFAAGDFHQSALELPDGAATDAVRGVADLDVSAVVLDADLSMRVLRPAARESAGVRGAYVRA
ncbi:MAG: hypothetical protein KDC46_02655 [Thermoleophilia bacterium]|nr:hypothetical protein [Thermoleophilia bacterium]